MHTAYSGKAEEKMPLRPSRHRWAYNIKMNFKKIRCNGMEWINFRQDMDEW
jgi:hypothetical protein